MNLNNFLVVRTLSIQKFLWIFKLFIQKKKSPEVLHRLPILSVSDQVSRRGGEVKARMKRGDLHAPTATLVRRLKVFAFIEPAVEEVLFLFIILLPLSQRCRVAPHVLRWRLQHHVNVHLPKSILLKVSFETYLTDRWTKANNKMKSIAEIKTFN